MLAHLYSPLTGDKGVTGDEIYAALRKAVKEGRAGIVRSQVMNGVLDNYGHDDVWVHIGFTGACLEMSAYMLDGQVIYRTYPSSPKGGYTEADYQELIGRYLETVKGFRGFHVLMAAAKAANEAASKAYQDSRQA